MQPQRSPKINFREIFWVVRFSTFATISAQSRPPMMGTPFIQQAPLSSIGSMVLDGAVMAASRVHSTFARFSARRDFRLFNGIGHLQTSAGRVCPRRDDANR